MKNSILVVVLFVASMIQFSCSKQEVAPVVSAKDISGVYQVTYLALNKDAYNLPYTESGLKLTGTMTFTPQRDNEDFINSNLRLFLNGQVQSDDNFNGIELKDRTFDSCSLYDGGLRIGRYYTIGGYGAIEITGVDDTGNRVIVRCQK